MVLANASSLAKCPIRSLSSHTWLAKMNYGLNDDRNIFMEIRMIYHAYVGQGNTYKSKNGATVHILW